MKTKTELLQLLGEDRMEDFFSLAEQEAGHDDQLLLLKGNWHNLQNQLHAGTLDQDDYNKGVALVRQGLLHWTKGFATPMPQTAPHTRQFRFNYMWVAVGLALGFFLFWRLTMHSKSDTAPKEKTEEPGAEVKSPPKENTSSRPSTPAATNVRPSVGKIKAKLISERLAKFHTTSRRISYEVVDAELEPVGNRIAHLHIQVLFRNEDDFTANFWNSSFRLAVGQGTRRLAPTGDLSEVVLGKSEKEGVVTFTVPQAERSFELFIQDYDKEKGIKISL